MTDFVQFVKKHIKAGKTIYRVMAFPFQKEAFVSTLRVTAMPTKHVSGFRGPLFFSALDSNSVPLKVSLMDVHRWGNPRYNFHRLFSSKKKAMAYAALVKAGSEIRSIFGYSAEDMTALFDSNQERREAGLLFEAHFPREPQVSPKRIEVTQPHGPTPQLLTGVTGGIHPGLGMTYLRPASR